MDGGILEGRIEGLRKRIEKIETLLRSLDGEYTFENCRVGDTVEIKDDVVLYKIYRKNVEEKHYPVFDPSVTLKNVNDLSIITIERRDFKKWVKLVRRW